MRGRDLHGADGACQTLGGGRLDRAVADAFLEAVSPAGLRACAEAVGELEAQHAQRRAQQRLALEGSEYEAARAKRQYDACEPEHRLVARTLERAYEQTLVAVEREQRKLAALERNRPAPLTELERKALARLARDLPRLWAAPTTADRDRKELLRTLIAEVVVSVRGREAHAEVEIAWEGGAPAHCSACRSTGAAPNATAHPSRRPSSFADSPPTTPTVISPRSSTNKAGAPAPASPSTSLASRACANVRRSVQPPARPRQRDRLDRRRIRLSDEVRRRFVPEVPDGYVSVGEAAKQLGAARQTVLHQIQRGERHAIQVTQGRRKGLRIEVSSQDAGLFAQ